MALEIDGKTLKWLLALQIISATDHQNIASSIQIKQPIADLFENGVKISPIVQELCKKKGLPIPMTLNHLKSSTQSAAKLYNWNILNQCFRKMDFEIDAETKNMVINGDREHLAYVLRKLHAVYEANDDELQDSLETEQFKQKKTDTNKYKEPIDNAMKESLSLSKSEEPPTFTPFTRKNSEQVEKLQKMRNVQQKQIRNTNSLVGEGDLLEYIINQLMRCLKLTKKQAIALLSDNNKYLAHVLVKGVKGQFLQIQDLLERWFTNLQYIVDRMTQQNDMCFFFLQIVKPTLLSKNQEVAQWGSRILSKIAYQLANKEMLPLAYDWFVREAGGLSTTILALTRHPKLNQHVVSYILQFARFNVTELFTIELKKITSNDNLSYVKFMLLIFDPLVQSKISSQQLLTSGAIDYWVQNCLKGADNTPGNSVQLRLYSIEFLTKIWRAYPLHIEESLDKVNQIMGYIKKGIRQSSEIMRFTLLELLFNLLDQFASKRNPYASIVYKKLTFLFIQNHEQLNIRQFMLRNFCYIMSKYPTIPVQIFLEPFVKQIKTRESKSYFINIFDMQFMNVAVNHKKLKEPIALDLFDLLAKTKLNSYQFSSFADESMDVLLDRFLDQSLFFDYTVKLVKISLAMFYSTLKDKKNEKTMSDQERLQAQKRAQIVNFVISLVERNSSNLNEEIKNFVIHLKIQIQKILGTTHKGIERILSMFTNIQEDIQQALQNARQKDELDSNLAPNTKNNFQLPRLDSKYLSKQNRDETMSQQSFQSQGTKYSKSSKQQFPQKDYTKFAEEDEQKFLKEHGMGLKKRNMKKKEVEKEVDPKVQEQIAKTKLRKQEEQRKRIEEQEKIDKRKEILKNKIQKQLQQRNLMQGLKGNQKDVEVKVIFDENEINQKLFDEEEELCRQISVTKQENRDSESLKLVTKRYMNFLKKIFIKYACGKVNKKDYFQNQGDTLAQIDLVRICKEKNLEKSKPVILQILKGCNEKNTKSLTVETFYKFIEALVAYLYIKERASTHFPMGDYLKGLIKKMAVGQNIKMEEDQDQQTKALTQKVRYNPHIQLPQGYKKIYQRVYQPKRECTYAVKRAIKNESLLTCYQIVNQLIFNIFKIHSLQQQVRFFQEARVVVKKNNILPPRPLKKQKQEAVSLLEDKQDIPITKNKRTYSNMNKQLTKQTQTSFEREKENSKPKLKIMNALEKKKLEEQQAKRIKKQQEDEQFRKRQQEIKRKFQKLQEEKERQKSKQKEQTKQTREQEQEKKRKEKEEKEKYYQQQKQKLQKYKRQQQEKEKQQKQKGREVRTKQEEERKQKAKLQFKKQEQKRREQQQKAKRDRELSEEKNKKKKDEQDKKKQALRQQVLKKLGGQKQKYEIQKLYKELIRKIFQESDIQQIFSNYKEQLKALFNYGKQYNEFKLGDNNAQTTLEQRGWINICQQLSICDVSTASNLLKINQKQKGRTGFSYEDFLQNLMNIGVKKDIEQSLEDYDQVHKICISKLDKYIKGLKIPKDKQSIKQYFIQLKNNQKKRQEPGQKQLEE